MAGAAAYGWLIYNCAIHFLYTHRISDILTILFLAVFAGLLLARSMPDKQNPSLYDWLIGILGTYLLTLFQPTPLGRDFLVFELLQLIGLVIAFAGLLSLNKSVGLVAANRGIKTSGMYRYIRHPIYAGYLLQWGSYLCQNISVMNTVLILVWAVIEMLRLFAEEAYLSHDPVYQAYKEKVRWRIIPYVF